MAVQSQQTTDVSAALERATTIDLSALGLEVPSGTTATIEVNGDRSRYEVVLERRGDRWIVEGAGDSAELTGVYGDHEDEKPEHVPGWIVRVLAEFDIREVAVRR
ncbi:hypothetical protein [Halomontanus rarus]|uniref:hypothetical protein n=1 Tax=Halomontanus rarus TaxID=3034020 RepID=UPI0023E7F460|nr:hypothetical protein [Halovivax sp. TS33]